MAESSHDPVMNYHNYLLRMSEFDQKLHQSSKLYEEAVLADYSRRTEQLTEVSSKAKIAAEQALTFAARAEFFAFENLRIQHKILTHTRIGVAIIVAVVALQLWQI